jgi:hypothetical protein
MDTAVSLAIGFAVTLVFLRGYLKKNALKKPALRRPARGERNKVRMQ